MIVSTYVPSLERVRPSLDMKASNLEDVLKITHRWNPLNQEESPVTRMHDLYPNYFRMPMTACLEQYSIPLLVYVDKEDIQPMDEYGMFIRNHNFQQSAKLVSAESKYRTSSFVQKVFSNS